MAKICAWWYSGGWFYAGAQCWATGQKSDCNDVNHLADKVHSSCKDFVCEAFIGFSNSYRGRARERQQTPCGNGAPGALGSQLQRSWLALGCVRHFPECLQSQRKKKKVKAETDQAHGLHQAKGQPVGLSGSLVAPCCARAGWAHRSARPQTRSRGAASGAGEGRAITLLFYWQERGVPLVLHQSAGHCLPQGPARLCSHWQASADSEVTRAGESLSRAEGSSSSTTMCYQPAECRARDWQPY